MPKDIEDDFLMIDEQPSILMQELHLELGPDECESLFTIVKEDYVLATYRPGPNISRRDLTWLRRFKQFARAARNSEPADTIEQWTEFRVMNSENGYSVIMTSAVADALDRTIRALLAALDETDVHSRTGYSRDYYLQLSERLFYS